MAKKALNKWTAPKSVAPEKIIQFGEGNLTNNSLRRA